MLKNFKNIYNIVKSKLQTKKWRKEQKWYKNGKSNECEKFQRKNLETFLGVKIEKTTYRISTSTLELKKNPRPMINNDGFEWTEDFDGILTLNTHKMLFNFKIICDKGGSQTRTLREVYHFIKSQLDYSLLNLDKSNNDKNSIYFINILEGDTCYNSMKYYNYLLSNQKYSKIKNKVFVGDFVKFIDYYNSLEFNK
jgi:hypothetical protein